MLSRFFILSFCILLGNTVFSQVSPINCTTEQNNDRTYSIFAENSAYADYTVKLTFNNLVGYKSYNINNDVAIVTASRGKKEVIKLTPENNASTYSFNYRYQYFPGIALRKAPAENSAKYLLPGTPDNVIRISKVSNIKETLNQKLANEFYSTGFMYTMGDTICATRAGLVYECSDAVKEAEKGNEIFRSGRNSIYVQHKDGTIGRYSIRNPIQLLVTPGDNVVPGQPLAYFNKESVQYSVLFSVEYLDEKTLSADKTNGSAQNIEYYKTIPASFCVSDDGKTIELETPNQTFKIVHPSTVIGAELSKKEKKKLGIQ